MRVLQISNNYYQTEIYGHLFSALRKHCTVKVFIPMAKEFSEEYRNRESSQNLIHCFLGEKRIFGHQINSSKFAKYIVKEGISEDIDLVHAHFVVSDGAIAYKLYKAKGIPYVISVRATCLGILDRRTAPHNILTALMVLKHARQIIFQTPVVRNRMMERIPNCFRKKLLQKSVVIPNGIDEYWLRNKNSPREKIPVKRFSVLTVAKLSIIKNMVIVAQIVQGLNEKGYAVDYKIAGSVKDPQLLEELGRYSQTKYMGALHKEELLKLYRESDIFVMVSQKETFGLVYGEALSQGLPVVYTKGEGFDGQFDEGVVGYHVPFDDFKQIEEAIVKIVSDYKRLSDNALNVVGCFNWDSIAYQFYEAYARVLMALEVHSQLRE